MLMTTKTLTIMEDAYEMLARAKRGDESFSDVIRRLTKKGSIMEFAGAWSDLTNEEVKRMYSAIEDSRARSRERHKRIMEMWGK